MTILALALFMLNPFGWGIYIGFVLVPIGIFNLFAKRASIDLGMILITLFAATYTVILGSNLGVFYPSTSFFLGYLFLPPTFYIIGKKISNEIDDPDNLLSLLLLFAFCLSFFPFLSNALGVIRDGFMTKTNMTLPWDNKDTYMSATLLAGYLSLNISLIPLMFVKMPPEKGRKYKIILLYLILIGVFSTLNMLRRTSLLIIIFTVSLFPIIAKNKKSAAVYVLIFSLILFGLFNRNILGIKDFYGESSLKERLDSSVEERGDIRFSMWAEALTTIGRYPTGNPESFNLKYSYAHNLWLDVGIKTGLIPLFFLIAFTVYILYKLLKFVFNKGYPEIITTLYFCFFLALMITFFVEPVMEGLLILFCTFCLFGGLLMGDHTSLKNAYYEEAS